MSLISGAELPPPARVLGRGIARARSGKPSMGNSGRTIHVVMGSVWAAQYGELQRQWSLQRTLQRK